MPKLTLQRSNHSCKIHSSFYAAYSFLDGCSKSAFIRADLKCVNSFRYTANRNFWNA
jgi:hypothetical protein